MPDGAPPQSDDELDSLAAQFHAGEGLPAESKDAKGAAKTEARDSDLDRDSDAEDDALDLDALRSSALGKRLSQRRGYAIAAREPKPKRLLSSWGLAIVMGLSLWSLWGVVPDLKYWVSDAKPIDLGHLGGYHLESAADGAYAHVEGIASPKRASYSRLFTEHELFPLIASRILIDRAQAADESMHGYGFPYSGEGRLVRAAEGSKWDAVREQFVNADELAHAGDIWLLEEGLSPRKGWRIPLEVGSWAAAALACAITLLLRAKKRAKDTQ